MRSLISQPLAQHTTSKCGSQFQPSELYDLMHINIHSNVQNTQIYTYLENCMTNTPI